MSLILKWVLIAAVVAWGIWTLRRNAMALRDQGKPKAKTNNRGEGVQATQACSHCGVHAAEAEMLRGQRGVYCCIQHCQAHGDHVQGG